MALAERGAAIIAQAADVADAKVLRSQASALEDIVRTQRMGDEALRAAKVLRLRCERRIGQLIAEGQAAGTIATRGHPEESSTASRFSDLGLSHDESSAFKRLAEVDDDTFDAAVNDSATVPTRRQVLNLARVRSGPTPHPAKFSDPLLPIFAAALVGYDRVLDPFAGTGKVHQLDGHRTVGVELEAEWARQHPATIVGNALTLPFPVGAFDAVCTSPTYGNRLADHHDARDGSERHSYTHDLGRPLHPDNSGALAWGERYRAFHERAWAEVTRVCSPSARFVLNVSDHIRQNERLPVAAWHIGHLCRHGWALYDLVPVETRRLRYGDNAEARPLVEYVAVFDRDDPI